MKQCKECGQEIKEIKPDIPLCKKCNHIISEHNNEGCKVLGCDCEKSYTEPLESLKMSGELPDEPTLEEKKGWPKWW